MTPPLGSGRTDLELALAHRAAPASPEGRAAAEELFRRHQARVVAWCRRFTRDPEEAMDLAQDALYTASRDLSKFEGRSSFTTWLFVVTRHACLRARRRRRLPIEPEADLGQVVDESPSPEEAFVANESHARVMDALERHLDERQRTAVWMKSFEGLSVDDITRALRLDDASGARGLLQTARRRLRAALGGDEGGRAS